MSRHDLEISGEGRASSVSAIEKSFGARVILLQTDVFVTLGRLITLKDKF